MNADFSASSFLTKIWLSWWLYLADDGVYLARVLQDHLQSAHAHIQHVDSASVKIYSGERSAQYHSTFVSAQSLW